MIMSKMISSKLIKEFYKAGVKPLKLKHNADPNKIVEIYTDAMRVRGMLPIKMTMKEWIKMHNRQMGQRVRRLREQLQKREELKKHRSSDRITFGFAYS